MTKLPLPLILPVTLTTILLYSTTSIHALGSSSTLAVTFGPSPAVCGIISSTPTHSITCFTNSQVVSAQPNVSFSALSGGLTFICGLRSGSYSFLCWDSSNFSEPQRVYFNSSALIQALSVGSNQICATLNDTSTSTSANAAIGTIKCWRGDRVRNPTGSARFTSISSGIGFSCGILAQNQTIRCWGSDPYLPTRIQSEFGNLTLSSIVCGGSHACGLDTVGLLVCKGDNSSGQLNVPNGEVPLEYSQVSLGENHTCGIRERNRSVICWGGDMGFYNNLTEGVSFESIVSGSNFTCGIISVNLSVGCWGPGWSGSGNLRMDNIPFSDQILPGPCVHESSCGGCGIFPYSQPLCSGSEVVCRSCGLNRSVFISPPPPMASTPTLSPPPPPTPTPTTTSSSPSRSKTLTTGLMVFAIIGSVGVFSGICTVIYCLWTGVCFGKKKVHNSVQPRITRNGSNSNGGGPTSSNNHSGIIISHSSTFRRQSSRAMRRQRSGTSCKHTDRAEEFSFAELVAATNDFAVENKIGSGSFGIVYRGKLGDGREVAIKRGEVGNKPKKLKEKESAFESELAFLSRVHHKHLVRLVGYCEDGDEERLLVYEYMKNGALYDHLHDNNNLEKSSSVINSWKMRIKIALDAARGIEYLHNYAVPPIIHRDIKSSNILIDASWTARVSDFGLSMMGPETERGKFQPINAAGTVGYIDPEYYGLNVLTAKSDVYGFGVVLLEILTGRRAIFKGGGDDDDDGEKTPTSLVDFAVPKIMVNELVKILDPRVGPPEINEAEAVELVAFTAMHCVHLEGKGRPTMTDIVANLERALSLCEGSHGSISSGTISIASDR